VHTITVRSDWLTRVKARGIAIVDGCLVLDAHPPPFGASTDALMAWVAVQGRGTSIVSAARRLYLRGGSWHLGAFPHAWLPTAFHRVASDSATGEDVGVRVRRSSEGTGRPAWARLDDVDDP
jgi:hypothetical protein